MSKEEQLRAFREQRVAAAEPKVGRPLAKDAAKTLTKMKPWEKEGVSRATWYRLQKKR